MHVSYFIIMADTRGVTETDIIFLLWFAVPFGIFLNKNFILVWFGFKSWLKRNKNKNGGHS